MSWQFHRETWIQVFLTTLGLVRETRSGNRVSKISTLNQLKKSVVM